MDEETILALFPNGVPEINLQDSRMVVQSLNIFNELGVEKKNFALDEKGYISVNGKDFSEKIPSKNMVFTAYKLNALKEFRGFESLANGFSNPTQFSATRFEVDCAFFMHQFRETDSIEFSPEMDIGGSKKYPEFVCSLGQTDIFCECKSLESLNRIKTSKVVRLMDEIKEDLRRVTLDENRIEIGFKSLPPHWNRNFGEQLAASIQVLIDKDVKDKHIELTIDGKHRTWIKLCNVGDNPYLKCTLNLANKPRGEAPTLVLGEIPNLKKDIKSLIRDALSQLPFDSLSVVFIYSLNETMSAEAISEFFNDNEHKNLIGVMSWTSKQIFHQNPNCKAKFQNLVTIPNKI